MDLEVLHDSIKYPPSVFFICVGPSACRLTPRFLLGKSYSIAEFMVTRLSVVTSGNPHLTTIELNYLRKFFFKEIPQESPAFMQGRNAALKPRSYFFGEAGNK